MASKHFHAVILGLVLVSAARAAQLPLTTDESTTIATSTAEPSTPWPENLPPVDTVAISCQPDSILLTISLGTQNKDSDDNYLHDDPFSLFNGIVYPVGLGTNSSCLREYRDKKGDLHYTLPLRSCNTMSTDKDDGTVEFFNNIVIQPHLRLVTGQGRGYHVSCQYKRKQLTQYHHYHDGIRASRLSAQQGEFADDEDADSLPSCTMKIYKGDPEDKKVASNVKIGEDLTLVVALEKQASYGLLVSECVVRDGLGWAEQNLIADDGCPLDGDIMGLFHYSRDKREARVSFPAHKFPYSASVYYTCEVKLCDINHPTDCEPCSEKRRVRRQSDDGTEAKVEVFSSLYVDDADTPGSSDVTRQKNEDDICISQRNFAIGICIAGVILMVAVIAAIACILARRRNPKTHSRTGSSLYSGPYTNGGYSHTS